MKRFVLSFLGSLVIIAVGHLGVVVNTHGGSERVFLACFWLLAWPRLVFDAVFPGAPSVVEHMPPQIYDFSTLWCDVLVYSLFVYIILWGYTLWRQVDKDR